MRISDWSSDVCSSDLTLREQDKPFLNEFASVIREHHPNVLVTVEGFADPAGSAAYNKRLGQRRAEAVREQLVQAGGLRADKVRAVSYGEDANRQVVAGAWGPEGEANRPQIGNAWCGEGVCQGGEFSGVGLRSQK